MTGENNMTTTVSLPIIGVQTQATLTVVAKSPFNEVISMSVSITGVVTKRTTMEAMFVYPTTPVLNGADIDMSLTNLSQSCGDFYTITLNDPMNATVLDSVNNTDFSTVSTVNGYNLVLLSYTTRLTTISSEKFEVRGINHCVK
jgi:hypothetical protein